MTTRVLTVCAACKAEFDRLLAENEAFRGGALRTQAFLTETQNDRDRERERADRLEQFKDRRDAVVCRLLWLVDFLACGEERNNHYTGNAYKPRPEDVERHIDAITVALKAWREGLE